MKRTLYLDLETIPGPESGKDLITVKPPAAMKKQETIDKWFAEKADDAKHEAYLKQSFNGGYGQICAFSYAVDDNTVMGSIATNRHEEQYALKDAFYNIDNALEGHNNPYVCGHFVSGFDLRFLMHRCVVLGVKMPHWLQTTCNAAAWDKNVIDTMQVWAGNRGTIGLSELCTILGIEGKEGMDGSKVYEAWLAGEHEAIGRYCDQDVEMVRAVHRKFVAVGL